MLSAALFRQVVTTDAPTYDRLKMTNQHGDYTWAGSCSCSRCSRSAMPAAALLKRRVNADIPRREVRRAWLPQSTSTVGNGTIWTIICRKVWGEDDSLLLFSTLTAVASIASYPRSSRPIVHSSWTPGGTGAGLAGRRPRGMVDSRLPAVAKRSATRHEPGVSGGLRATEA